MTFWEALDVVAAVRYGPAFPFVEPRATLVPALQDCAGVGAVLTVSARVYERSSGEPVIASTSTTLGLHLLDRPALLLAIRLAWVHLATHEIDEGFRFEGALPFDPHWEPA